MKKILVLIVTAFVIYGCSNPTEVPNINDKDTGSINVTFSEGSRSYTVKAASYSIKVVNEGLGVDISKVGNPGDSISISSLKPGDYSVTVKGFDSEEKEVMSGDTIVAVKAGKVATAKISLKYTSGGFNLELDLPALIEEPSTTPKRVKKSGEEEYTYDENGFITKFDKKSPWGVYYVEYKVESGRRVGSEKYELIEGEYKLVATSVITHDDSNREKLEMRYNTNGEVIEKVTVDYDETNGGKTITFLNPDNSTDTVEYTIITSKTYDSLGRFVKLTKKGGHDFTDTWWFNKYTSREPKDDDYFTKDIKYKGDSWLLEKETFYLNDELLATLEYGSKEPGIYTYAELRSFEGYFLQGICYGNLFEYGNSFAQRVTTQKPRNYDQHKFELVGVNTSLTLLYSRDLCDISNTDWISTYEEGEVKENQIPY